jgi:hypothetical protein
MLDDEANLLCCANTGAVVTSEGCTSSEVKKLTALLASKRITASRSGTFQSTPARREADLFIISRSSFTCGCLAYDAVGPEQPSYAGPGWYRRKLQVRKPFVHGRTLLLFEGAGQKCEVLVSLERVGEHVGGYDEFGIDITDATAKAAETAAHVTEFPLAVLCDNSRDWE